MKRLLATIMILVSLQATAQDYHTGIGLRLGGLSSGITVKHFVNSSAAVEGILSFGYHSFLVTGLYEVHQSIPDAPGLKWYYGGGAHIGFFNYGGYYRTHRNYVYYVEYPGDHAAVLGIDGIVGMEYKFNKAPVNLGLDIKPFIDIYNGVNGYFEGALSFRFVF
jgi:hypothetical protein